MKTELSGGFREVCVEQLAKNQGKLEFDKLAEELHTMSVAICELRNLYEEVQYNLHRKDFLYNQISSSNEKLQAEYSEKLLKLEGENRDLVLATDESFARIQNLEKKIGASSEELSGLKRLLSVEHNLNLKMQKTASMDQKERDDYIFKLEEENRTSQEQLKWKSEQFSHLEEAHRTLQIQFQESKLEWQKEKSSLLDEISSLQLDAQIRATSECPETWFMVSNQDVANEEIRRKVQVLESRSKFENVILECQAAKLEIDQLTMKRDEEIAELRILFSKKGILAKGLKQKIQQLEQGNSGQINNSVTSSSLEKLKNELQYVEQLNGKCDRNLTEKETESNSQIENFVRDMTYCFSQLDEKNRSIRGLHKKLEDTRSLLVVKNEGILALMKMLKYGFDLVESLESLSQKDNIMYEELKRYKSMLDESKQCQRHLQQQFYDIENAVPENIKNAVERENFELRNKLQSLESEAETLKLRLKENQQAHEQETTSFLVSMNYKGAKIGSLEQQVSMVKLEIAAKSEDAEMIVQERGNNIQLAEDKNDIIKNLQNEIAQLQIKMVEREVTNFSILDANKTLGQENERLVSTIKEKEKKIQELQKELESLDRDFRSAMISNAEKVTMLSEALKEAEDLKILEVEEKNRVISNLEKETKRLCMEVEFREESLLLQSIQVALRCEETKKSEIQEVKCQLEKETRWFENLLEELQSHKHVLLEDKRKEKINRENVVEQLEKLCQQIGFLCTEDVELMDMLSKLSPLNEEGSKAARNKFPGDELSNTSPSRKSVQVTLDDRTPLAELNVGYI